MSVRPSARNISTAAKRIFIKFHTYKHYKIMPQFCMFCGYLSITGAVIKSYTRFCVRVSSKSLPTHSTEVGNTLRLLLARRNTTNSSALLVCTEAVQSPCSSARVLLTVTLLPHSASYRALPFDGAHCSHACPQLRTVPTRCIAQCALRTG